MRTSDADANTTPATAERPPTLPLSPKLDRPSHRGFLGALLLVVLVGGVAAAVFTQLAQHRGGGPQAPSANTWEKVLSGYTISEVAQSSPGVLYACATKGGNPVTSIGISSDGTYTNPSFTILQSVDDGARWTDIGAKAQFAGGCQLAANPAERDEVYVVSDPRTVTNDATQLPYLMHTTDSGRTWSRIDPTASLSGRQIPISWSIQDLRMEDGGRLFGLIPVSLAVPVPSETPPIPLPRFALSFQRLAMSQDGGQTWSLLDDQFQSAQLDARSYAVDPASPDTVYLMVGQPIGPMVYQNPHSATLPAYPPQPEGLSSDLYRTTNGGSSWDRVLANLPFGMTVQVAGSALVYVGGSPSPIPVVANSGGAVPPQAQSASGAPGSYPNGFEVRVSRDRGATWQSIAPLPQQASVDRWFVAPDGSVYVYEGGIYISSGSGTAVPGSSGSSGGSAGGNPGQGGAPPATGVAGTPVTSPPPTIGAQAGMTPQATNPPPLPADAAVGTLGVTGKNLGFRYDPATATWGTLAMPQIEGALVAVTSVAQSTGETALWFVDLGATGGGLYRDLV